MTVIPGPFVGESEKERDARERMIDLLLEHDLVTQEQLDFATWEHAATGDGIAEILVAHGAISEDVHVAALCEMHLLQRVRLADAELDPEITGLLERELCIEWQVLPVALSADGTLLVAVARPLESTQLGEIEKLVDRRVEQLIAGRLEMDEALQRVNAQYFLDISTNALRENAPEFSAHVVAIPAQKAGFVGSTLIAVICLAFWPIPTLVVLIAIASLIYLIVSVYKFQLTIRALGTRLELDITEDDIADLPEYDLPMYSILVPLYREAGVVSNLVRGINELNYPRNRLDVKLLCEIDDDETIAKIRALELPPQFHLVIVPESLPKTKPKACNYGLQMAAGELCVIYDAEDRPDPDQLKKAVIAFRRLGEGVVCIQAKLNHYNQHQNILTASFANEYAMHFGLMLPAMAAADAPIPLGGTSNHFVTSVLRELGAWDAYNVTEDADLGLRLHRAGHRTAMIDSTTLEEANSQVANWIRQRSRWNKGYIQTWLVHMRHPLTLLSQTGPRGFMSLNLTLGSAAVLLLNPIFWFLTTLYLFTRLDVIEQIFPGAIFYIASSMLFIGNFIFLFLNVAGGLHRGDFSLTRTALLSPLYWGLMSYAAWKGFIQLFTNPFYWEKTEHGLDSAHQGEVRQPARPVRKPARTSYGAAEYSLDDLLSRDDGPNP